MHKFIVSLLLFFFMSGTFTTAFNPVSASELVEDSWNTKTPMNHTRYGFSATVVDGQIYAIGGLYYTFGNSSIGENPSVQYARFLDTNERYDPKTDTWTTLAPMPTPRGFCAVAAYQGKIYCISGVNYEVGAKADVVEVYDPVTNSWNTKASPPFGDGIIQALVVDDKIFVTYSNLWIFMYDPIKDSWTEKTLMPCTGFAVFTVMDNKIMGIVRPADNENQMKAMSYDPKTDRWKEEKTVVPLEYPSGPGAAGATAGVYAPKRVYVFGARNLSGNPESGATPFTWVYDSIKSTWSTAKASSADVSDLQVAVVDDILYVLGSTNQQYVPIGYDPLGYQAPSAEVDPAFILKVRAGVVLTICTVIICAYFLIKRKRSK
jgi:N-acetylneuraminic acid mutarotase